jgi:hypothetical protein
VEPGAATGAATVGCATLFSLPMAMAPLSLPFCHRLVRAPPVKLSSVFHLFVVFKGAFSLRTSADDGIRILIQIVWLDWMDGNG